MTRRGAFTDVYSNITVCTTTQTEDIIPLFQNLLPGAAYNQYIGSGARVRRARGRVVLSQLGGTESRGGDIRLVLVSYSGSNFDITSRDVLCDCNASTKSACTVTPRSFDSPWDDGVSILWDKYVPIFNGLYQRTQGGSDAAHSVWTTDGEHQFILDDGANGAPLHFNATTAGTVGAQLTALTTQTGVNNGAVVGFLPPGVTRYGFRPGPVIAGNEHRNESEVPLVGVSRTHHVAPFKPQDYVYSFDIKMDQFMHLNSNGLSTDCDSGGIYLLILSDSRNGIENLLRLEFSFRLDYS